MKNKVLFRLGKNLCIGNFKFKSIRYFKLEIGRLGIFCSFRLPTDSFKVDITKWGFDGWFKSCSVNFNRINIEFCLLDYGYYQKRSLVRK